MTNKILEGLAERIVDVLEWLYDHDVKKRVKHPFKLGD